MLGLGEVYAKMATYWDTWWYEGTVFLGLDPCFDEVKKSSELCGRAPDRVCSAG